MGHLVRDDVGQRAVPCDERWCDKGQLGIFHPAVRERRRKQQQVVATPHVGPSNGLARGEEVLRLGEFVRPGIDHLRLAPHDRPWTDLAALEIAHGERCEVGGNGNALLEGERARIALHAAAQARARERLRRPCLAAAGLKCRRSHHCHEWRRGKYHRGERRLDCRAVLAHNE